MTCNNTAVTEKDLQETIELTKSLVAIQTESPEGIYYAQFVDYLESFINRELPGVDTERVVVKAEDYKATSNTEDEIVGDRISLILRAPAPNMPKVHISDHYDVVHAGDLSKWTITSPYEAVVHDGRLYGRGSADPKGSIASLIQALKVIYREGRALKYDLVISFTPDGELSNHTGLDHLIDLTQEGRDYFEVDFFLSIDGAQNYISTGKTGLIQFFITINGQASHIARAFMGVNAIHLASPVLVELTKLSEEICQRTSSIRVNPELPYNRVRPDLAVTTINGGSSFESVPDKCTIQGHRLVVADESDNAMEDAMDEIVSTIMRVKQKYQIPMKFKVEPAIPPFATDANHPALRELAEIAAAGAGMKEYPTACSEGYNDISAVNYRLGVPMFARGVQWADSNAHSYNENIRLDALKTGIRDLVAFLSE